MNRLFIDSLNNTAPAVSVPRVDGKRIKTLHLVQYVLQYFLLDYKYSIDYRPKPKFVRNYHQELFHLSEENY